MLVIRSFDVAYLARDAQLARVVIVDEVNVRGDPTQLGGASHTQVSSYLFHYYFHNCIAVE